MTTKANSERVNLESFIEITYYLKHQTEEGFLVTSAAASPFGLLLWDAERQMKFAHARRLARSATARLGLDNHVVCSGIVVEIAFVDPKK